MLRKATESDPKAVWNVIAPELLRQDSTGIRLRLKLEHWFGELIPAEVLVEWARNQGRKGFLMAAALLAGKSRNLSDSVRMLVREAANPREVLNQLAGSLASGSFTGPISGHMELQVAILRSWAQDPEPRIRNWAQAALTSAEKSVRRQKFLEEEEEEY